MSVIWDPAAVCSPKIQDEGINLRRKMMNHNGSEADMDELPTNPESKHTEYTENERVMSVIERTLQMR
jgi:hypothetical protein